MTRSLIRSLALVLPLVALPAAAQNGRIPIPFATPVVTPITITAPGSYVVTRNLAGGGVGAVIDIVVPAFPGGDVDIDLNGMILDNTADPFSPVIRLQVVGSSEVTIRNGTLIGGSTGIEAFGPGRKLVVEDVKISDFTAFSHLAGIHILDVFNTAIRRCVIIDVAGGPGAAIFLDGGIPRQATIEDNLIQNTMDGIIATPQVVGLEISNNRLINIQPGGVFGAAINLDGAESCLVAQNTINFAAAGAGIRLNFSQGCKVYNNTILNTSGNGIALSTGADGNLILDNVVRRASTNGIFVDGASNHINGNVSTGNVGYGLRFGPASFDNNMGRNSASANGGVGPGCLFPWSPDLCDDAGPPGVAGPPNWSFGDNLMPGAAGAL